MFKLIVAIGFVLSMSVPVIAQPADAQGSGQSEGSWVEIRPPGAVRWDSERYLDLVHESDAAYQDAQGLEGDARDEHLEESLRLREQARGLLRSSLLSGALDEYGEGPHQDLLDLSQNVVALRLQLDRCDDAAERLDYVLGDALLMPDGAIEQLRELRDSIRQCRERVAPTQAQAVEQPAAPEMTPEATAATAPVEEAERPVVPWVLIGSGGAMVIGALATDLALDGRRNEFQIIQNDCRDGCSPDQHDLGVSLRDELHRAKIATGVLYGVGLAAGITGVVLLFTGDDEPEDRPVAVTPEVGPGAAGAVMSIRF